MIYYDALVGLPGKGPVPSDYAIVGSAPSTKRPANAKFEPFGSRSHQIIDNIRKQVPSLYVTNAVKISHAPGKEPRIALIREHAPKLIRELELVSPRRILTLGDVPSRILCGEHFKGIRDDRGTFFWNANLSAWIVPTYHFSAGGRNPELRRYIGRDIERFFSLPEPELIDDYLVQDNFKWLRKNLPEDELVYLDIETTGLEYDAKVTQIGLSWGEQPPILFMDPTPEGMVILGSILKERKSKLLGHNLQFDLRCMLYNTQGLWPDLPVNDTMLLAHLRGEGVLGLKHLTTLYTDRPGPHSGGSPGDPQYLAEDVESTREVARVFTADTHRYVYRVLRDLVPLVADIYHRGVYIDRQRLEEVKATSTRARDKTLAELEAASKAIGINWNSPAQVIPVLEKAGIPLTERTEAGALSIKETVLLPLAEEYPLVKSLLAYRAAAKAISGFIDPYLETTSDEHPFLHPTLRLTGTDTGRLSCSNPNLQQVTREGPLKEVFVGRWEDSYYGGVDLEQAELRIAALLSGDEALLEALLSEDTHRFIASKLFGIPQDKVTPTQRKASKKTTFGVLYGGSARGLAEKAGLTVKDIQEILNLMSTEFKVLWQWMKTEQHKALSTGKIDTIFGRTRPMDTYLARDEQSRIKRLAVNTPIQSAASDSMLVITRGVHRRMKDRKLRSNILFGVHDSLWLEVAYDEVDAVARIVQQAFTDLNDTPLGKLPAFDRLPLTGGFLLADSWAAAESTNAAYAPQAEWSCNSLGVIDKVEGWIREEKEDWEEWEDDAS